MRKYYYKARILFSNTELGISGNLLSEKGKGLQMGDIYGVTRWGERQIQIRTNIYQGML